jgi:hypothetical protein
MVNLCTQSWTAMLHHEASLWLALWPLAGILIPAISLTKRKEITMSFNLGDLMIDERASKQGVWVDWLGGSRLKLASTSSHQYKATIARLYKANRLQLDDSNPNNYQLIQEISAEALASTVLLDWEGISWPNPDGTITDNAPYTKALGKEAISKVDALREFVSEKAGTASLFKAEIVEEATKN